MVSAVGKLLTGEVMASDNLTTSAATGLSNSAECFVNPMIIDLNLPAKRESRIVSPLRGFLSVGQSGPGHALELSRYHAPRDEWMKWERAS